MKKPTEVGFSKGSKIKDACVTFILLDTYFLAEGIKSSGTQ